MESLAANPLDLTVFGQIGLPFEKKSLFPDLEFVQLVERLLKSKEGLTFRIMTVSGVFFFCAARGRIITPSGNTWRLLFCKLLQRCGFDRGKKMDAAVD